MSFDALDSCCLPTSLAVPRKEHRFLWRNGPWIVAVTCIWIFLAPFRLWPFPAGENEIRLTVGVLWLAALVTLLLRSFWDGYRYGFQYAMKPLFQFVIGVLMLFPAAFFSFVWALSVADGHDDFADHLVIPTDIEVARPISENTYSPQLSDAIRHGAPTMILQDGLQPGIYRLYAWANTGEPGEVYVRAIEVTQGTRLSEPLLSLRTTNKAQWSMNQDELFRYSVETKIYEGDWGYPYAARFELWFKPANGKPERKLVERAFRIEGWMR